jgi:hypothetical protein
VAGSPTILQRRLGSPGHRGSVTRQMIFLGGRRLDRPALLGPFGDLSGLVL